MVRYDPTVSLSMYFYFACRGLATRWCTSLTSHCCRHVVWATLSIPHQPPTTCPSSPIMEQGPVSEVREGDPQRDGCNNVPQRISD